MILQSIRLWPIKLPPLLLLKRFLPLTMLLLAAACEFCKLLSSATTPPKSTQAQRHACINSKGTVHKHLHTYQILVIHHRRQKADDQPPRPPGLRVACSVIHVLPQQPNILFVHANRLPEHHRRPLPVIEDGIEILDRPQAIAAQGE